VILSSSFSFTFHESWLKELSYVTYRDKAEFFEAVGQHFGAESTPDVKSPTAQALVFLIWPYVEAVGMPFFKEKVVPQWERDLRRLRALSGLNGIGDVAVTQETLGVGLMLMREALHSVKSKPYTIEEQRFIEDVVVQLDVMMATPEDVAGGRALIQAIAGQEPLWKILSKDETLEPTAALVKAVNGWVSGQGG
jgi:hypothetical protein